MSPPANQTKRTPKPTLMKWGTSLFFTLVFSPLYAVAIAAILCYWFGWLPVFAIVVGLLAGAEADDTCHWYRKAVILPRINHDHCGVTWTDFGKVVVILSVLLSLPPLSGIAVDLLLKVFGSPNSGTLGVLVACGTYCVVWHILPTPPKREKKKRKDKKNDSRQFERGRVLLSQDEAERKAQKLCRRHNSTSQLRYWGGTYVPEAVLGPHFQVVGKTRSGKTLTLRLYMQSALTTIVPGSNRRAIVYDAKGELLPVLKGMDLPCPILSLNPLDAAGFAWDMASDITDPNAAKTVAEVFVPEEQETQKYFPRSARRILEAVLRHLIKNAPGKWNLADVLLILNDVKLLHQIMRSSPASRHLITKYFKPESTFKNTLSTLDTLVSRYETVAACWARAQEMGNAISLNDWLRTSSVLVISRNQDVRQALDPTNQLLFQRLFELLLAGPEVKSLPPEGRPRTWICLDEAAKAGELKALDDVLLQGGSKGISVILAYQDVLSMRQAYGDKKADALLAQCSNTAVYHVGGDATSQWASKLFGQFEAKEKFAAESRTWATHNSYSASFNTQRSRLDAVLPSEFYELKGPKETGRLNGFYITDGIGAYKASFEFADMLLPPKYVPVVHRTAADQELPDQLTPSDLERLGIATNLQAKSEQQNAKLSEQQRTSNSAPRRQGEGRSLRSIERLRSKRQVKIERLSQ